MDWQEEWAVYRQMGLAVDEDRWDLIQSDAPLVRPTPEHARPGLVKVTDGAHDFYVTRGASAPCLDQACRLYLWDDEDRNGIWLQHGDNPESVKWFPRRFFLGVGFPLHAERPDPREWIMACHAYADGA